MVYEQYRAARKRLLAPFDRAVYWRKVADRILDFYEFCQTFKQSEKTSYHKRDYLKKIGRKIVKKIIDNF